MLPIIKLLRPHQWAKNAFVFLPMFFGAQLLNLNCWLSSVLMALAFSLMASAIYCINDIKDFESDRRHPKKRFRPLASGQVSVRSAIVLMVILILMSLVTGCLCPHRWEALLVLLIYLVLNLGYSFRLKQFAIVDVFIVSFGFVLRLVGGGVVCGIWLSPWIVLMTFLLALFLSFAKRRDDVVIREQGGLVARKNTLRYNLQYLNITLGLLGAITIVCYIIYTVSPEVEARIGSGYVYISSIFVLAGILRYLQLAIVDVNSGSPTKVLLRDRFIQCCIMLWLTLFIILIYL